MKDEAEAAGVARAILRYLSRYPDASDTAEGIRQFWFPDRVTPPSLPVVNEALKTLVRDGFLIESSSRAARLYGGNRERLKNQEKD